MRESKLWAWHIVSAVVILVLLGLHMGTMHLGAILSFIGLGSTDPVAAEHVFARSRQAAYMVGYIILLGAGPRSSSVASSPTRLSCPACSAAESPVEAPRC